MAARNAKGSNLMILRKNRTVNSLESDKLANGPYRTTELFACTPLESRDAQVKDFKTLRYATKDSKQAMTAVIDFVCKGSNIFIFK